MKRINKAISKLLVAINKLINKTISLIIKTEKDKLLHFIAGTYIFMIAGIFFDDFISLLIVAFIGAAKEVVWDKLLNKGCFERKDFAYTVLGGGLTWIIFILWKI